MYSINKLFQKQQDYVKRLNQRKFIWGGLDRTDFEELYKLLTRFKKKNMKIAEIGCYVGSATTVLATIAKSVKGKVYSIDWFKGSPESNLDRSGDYFNIKNIMKTNIKEQKLDKYVEVIDKTSVEASLQFPDNYFDFIFIDADHRYSIFKQDLKVWIPKLKKNGIISGHDANILPKELANLSAYQEKDCIVIHVGITTALAEKLPNIKRAGKSVIWWEKI